MAGGGSTGATTGFEAVFGRLRGILEPYGRRLHVSADSATLYGIDMASGAERNPTTWFGGVRLGKRYVSYDLMPVYVEPSLLEGASPELRRRMQGKSCFNFGAIDEGLFAELEALTRRGYDRTAGDPTWGVTRREERGMAHRTAMSGGRRPRQAARRPRQAARRPRQVALRESTR
jgi:hypothetical protein